MLIFDLQRQPLRVYFLRRRELSPGRRAYRAQARIHRVLPLGVRTLATANGNSGKARAESPWSMGLSVTPGASLILDEATSALTADEVAIWAP